MPPKVPGEAVPAGSPAIQKLALKRWYIFKHYNPGSSQDSRTTFIVAYLLGWRECLSNSGSFAGLPEQLARLSDLLEDTRDWQGAGEQAVGDEDLEAERWRAAEESAEQELAAGLRDNARQGDEGDESEEPA